MFLAGDEFGRTQRGDNNAYCQDNEISWLNGTWRKSPPASKCGGSWQAHCAAAAASALRSRHFLHGRSELAPNLFDIAWFEADGELVQESSWKTPETRRLCLRQAMTSGDGAISLLSLLLNPTAEDHQFVLPPPPLPGTVLIDSAEPDANPATVTDQKVVVRSRSAMLVLSRLEPDPS
jgi:glycogen operon protein